MQYPQVTIIGSSNVDITALMARLPAPGETVLADSFQLTPGGKGANQALAARLAGAATEFVGAVGCDTHAEVALSQLTEAGVILNRVARTAEPTGVAIIQVDAAAENSIAVVPGANSQVTGAVVSALDGLHGILVLQGEIPASGITAAMAAATDRVVLNLAPVIELPRDCLLAANPLVVNEHEAALVLAQLDGTGSAGTENEFVIAQKLMEHGVSSVVVTLGAQGCLVAQAGEIEQIAAVEADAVDTTGAGDAFTGALSARLAQGEDLIHAAKFASKFAALTVQAHGAQSSYPRSIEGL